MDIFESLENLNVSEGCFNDIIELVEGLLTPVKRALQPVANQFDENKRIADETKKMADKAHKEELDVARKRNEFKEANKDISIPYTKLPGTPNQPIEMRKNAYQMNHPDL